MEIVKNEDLLYFSIHDTMSQEERDEYFTNIDKDVQLNRSVASMLGMAIGDFTGSFLEFLPAINTIKIFDIKKMEYIFHCNSFDLKFGQWTDDTSMGMCMADSLIVNKKFDGSDMRIRFWNWWNNGYNNAFRFDRSRSSSVGLGKNISNSLDLEPESIPDPEYVPPKYCEDAGNGSLMRLTPVPIFFQNDIDSVVEYSKKSSRTTHPGIQAADACGLMGYIIASAIKRDSDEDIKTFLERVTDEYLKRYEPCEQIQRLILSKEPKSSKEVCWNWKDSNIDINTAMMNRGKIYNGYPNARGYFGSYSVDGLAIALNSLYTTDSFDSAIERCVNYLGDADSTGSMAGQMAGAFYGLDSINKDLISALQNWDNGEIALKGAMLYNIAQEKNVI